MFVNGSRKNEQSLERTFHRCFLPCFVSFGLAVTKEKIFLEIDQSETRMSVATMFVNETGRYVRSL